MRHFLRGIPDISQANPRLPQARALDIPDRPRAAYGPPTLQQTFPRPDFPSISPSVPQHSRGKSQTVPELPMARQHYGRPFPGRAIPAFPQAFPKRAGGISQAIPKPSYGSPTLRQAVPRPYFPCISPSGRAGYPRPSPSRLWRCNTTADISPTGLSQHFPSGISPTVPEPPMARQHYERLFPNRGFRSFPQAYGPDIL